MCARTNAAPAVRDLRPMAGPCLGPSLPVTEGHRVTAPTIPEQRATESPRAGIPDRRQERDDAAEAGSMKLAASGGAAPQGVELRHLCYFVAVADAGTFTHAAEQMFIAQPTLSQQIRRLEEMVGTPLLQRRREGVRPGTGQNWRRRAWRPTAARFSPPPRLRRHRGRTRSPSSASWTATLTGRLPWSCRKPCIPTGSLRAGKGSTGSGCWRCARCKRRGSARGSVRSSTGGWSRGLACSATAAGSSGSRTSIPTQSIATRAWPEPLVHTASRYAQQDLAAQTQVIVADQTGTAIRIYRSIGFRDAETQVQLQRQQPG
jgi:Bacterial regulatory helix-turn-helix protein, lysR family